MAEQPGAAFLRRRLARAQAVPPAERSPEVQAFITSLELGRQACELLPLELGSGEARPALPLGDPATTRRCGCWGCINRTLKRAPAPVSYQCAADGKTDASL